MKMREVVEIEEEEVWGLVQDHDKVYLFLFV